MNELDTYLLEKAIYNFKRYEAHEKPISEYEKVFIVEDPTDSIFLNSKDNTLLLDSSVFSLMPSQDVQSIEDNVLAFSLPKIELIEERSEYLVYFKVLEFNKSTVLPLSYYYAIRFDSESLIKKFDNLIEGTTFVIP